MSLANFLLAASNLLLVVFLVRLAKHYVMAMGSLQYAIHAYSKVREEFPIEVASVERKERERVEQMIKNLTETLKNGNGKKSV